MLLIAVKIKKFDPSLQPQGLEVLTLAQWLEFGNRRQRFNFLEPFRLPVGVGLAHRLRTLPKERLVLRQRIHHRYPLRLNIAHTTRRHFSGP